MDCSLLRNGNHTLHQKSWGGPSNFLGGPPTPPVVAPLIMVPCCGKVTCPLVVDVLQRFTSLLSDSMSSHLHSLGVASGDVQRLLDRAVNLSRLAPPSDDVTAMTSRLVAEMRQLVLDIGAANVSSDHVTEIYRTAETGRRIAEQTFNTTQHAMYIRSHCLLLHFARVGDDAKCILVTRVCLSVCLSVRRRILTLLHGPGCNLGNARGCLLVVYCWADLQSVHGFRCYDNVTPNAKCQRVLVLALCPVYHV